MGSSSCKNKALTMLMIQLQSFSRVFLVLLTALLGLIGVTAALLLFDKPFGFVAIMGGLAIATLLTVLFLPALYAAWFRVKVH